jgi:predicted ArsR family transcriptional regulator
VEIDQSLDAPTRERVARSILENGPSTAAALGERLALTPAAVRRHLDHLLADGAIEPRSPRVALRGRGRPAKLFALTETGGEAAVKAFADRRAGFIEEQFASVAASRPDLSPAGVLAFIFTGEGYAASARDLPVGEQLCQQHCPVSHVAHEFPQLCEAETEAISRVLDTHVQRLATIAHGDGVCTTCIPKVTTRGVTR